MANAYASPRGDTTPRNNQQLRPPASALAAAGCGLIAATLYTCANIALRQCVNIDPLLVSAVKAAPTVIVLSPFLVWMRFNGQRIATSYEMVPRFIVVALLGQFVGNAAFQFALGSIGLAASVPITLGVLIGAGSVLARLMLGEPIRRRTIVAMVILVVAVVLLSQPGATSIPADSESAMPTWMGAGCAAASGIAYALFGTVMRQSLQRGLSAPATMWISGVVGMTSLWSATLAVSGLAPIQAITDGQWQTMAAAGVFNFLAFVALSVALKALSVTAVNLINTTQVAMAAIAGVALFSEPITWPLVTGILLTVGGLLILARRKPKPSTEE